MVSKEAHGQIRGIKQLLDDAFSAALDTTEKLHQNIATKPYRLLEKVDPIAAPARAVEQVQSGITHGVYAAIRGVHQVSSGLLDKVIALADPERDKKNQ